MSLIPKNVVYLHNKHLLIKKDIIIMRNLKQWMLAAILICGTKRCLSEEI